MLQELTPILVALISGGVITAVVQQMFGRQKTGAEAGRINIDAGLVVFETLKDLVNPLRDEVLRLAEAHKHCQEQLDRMNEKVQRLENNALP